MEAAVPGFKKNWWQRVYLGGDDMFRVGSGIFLTALGIVAVDQMLLPDLLFGIALIVGLTLVIGGFAHYLVGYVGHFLARRTRLSKEPWGGKNLTKVMRERVRRRFEQ